MVIIVLLIIAFWFMYSAGTIPLALAVLMTIFGSLSVLFSIIKICVNVYNKRHQPTRTGYNLLDRFLK